MSRNAVFSLVNGMWIPSLTVRAGEWTRLRFVFASIELSLVLWPPTSDGSEGGLDCEWKLLAKDGIYLNVAARDIQKVYLAPGQRSDVALRCRCASPRAPCGGSVVSRAELAGPPAQDGPAQRRRQRPAVARPPASPDEPHTRLERGTRGPFLGETTLEQELFRVEVRPADRAAAVPRPLRPFRARRPCYLVDLRRARVPRRNRGQLLFPNPGLPLTYAGRRWPVVLWSDRINMRKNASPWPWANVGRPMRHEHLQPPLHVMRGASVQEFYVRPCISTSRPSRYRNSTAWMDHGWAQSRRIVGTIPRIHTFRQVIGMTPSSILLVRQYSDRNSAHSLAVMSCIVMFCRMKTWA